MKPRLAVSLVLLALGALLAWWIAARGTGSPPALELPARSEPAHSQAESSPLESDSTAAREEKAAPAPLPTPTTSADPESADATLRARCVDEQGAPIAGVRLMGLDSQKPLALSAVDGRIDVTIPLGSAEGRKVRFDLLHTFYLYSEFERVLKPGQECDVGDVVLKLGACIRGTVVDVVGKPIARALVASSSKSLLSGDRQGDSGSVLAVSITDGSFTLEGVPMSAGCVGASADKHEAAEQCGLVLVPGRELAGIVITLRPKQVPDEPDASGLLVKVLQPSGEALIGALVSAELRDGDRKSISIGTTNEQGQRHLAAGAAATADIVVSDETHDRFASAFALDVPVSRGTLEIRLEQGTLHTLLVVDEHGAPVESYAARVLYEPQYHPARGAAMLRDTNGLLRDLLIGHGLMGPFQVRPEQRKPHVGGSIGIRTGSYAFVVQVDAAGFAPGEAGPYPALGAPDSIRVVLRRMPGIRGRVVAGGGPVAGAWVKLFSATEERHVVLVDGFLSRVEPVAEAQTKSADDGSFELPVRDAGRFVVQAGAEGLGEAETEVLTLEPSTGAQGIVLDLPALGAIEGHLLLPPGESARDLVIGASRGSGRSLSVRSDAEGKFRFEKLTPGAWLLRRLAEDVDPAGEGYEIRHAPRATVEIPSNCTVRPGETTRVEIDLRHKAVFVAHIELADWEGSTWDALLAPTGATFSRAVQLELVAAGELRMVIDQPGDYALTISGWNAGQSVWLEIEEHVHLDAGENAWTLGGPAGQLVIANSLSEEVRGLLACELSGGRQARWNVEIPAGSELTLKALPVGRWSWGRMQDDEGRPVEEAVVEIKSGIPARLECK